MKIGYIRPEKRFTAAKQRTLVFDSGVAEGKTYEEAERSRGDSYPMRDAAINSIRPAGKKGEKDQFIVSDFHRLASTLADLSEAVKAIIAKGGIIVEARTGRRVESASDLVDMVFEATEFYAQRGLHHAEAVKLGKKGAAASPVTKKRKGRMPAHMAQDILNDHTMTFDAALAKINRDRQFKEKYSKSLVYRMAREEKLKLRPRLSGRLPGRDT